jgi:hypothetical protein
MVMENQIVAEKAKAQESSRQARHMDVKEEEKKRLIQQLEAAKVRNLVLVICARKFYSTHNQTFIS